MPPTQGTASATTWKGFEPLRVDPGNVLYAAHRRCMHQLSSVGLGQGGCGIEALACGPQRGSA